MSAPGTPPAGASDRLARWLAIWFGCGHVPRAPGTMGTLGALPLYLLVSPGGPAAILATAAVVFLVGVWAATRVERATGLHDPQIVCIDEVAGVMLPLAATPRSLTGVIAAVVLFRVADMLKPWPARPAERLPEGWGVMADDLIAGVWAALVVLAARAIA